MSMLVGGALVGVLTTPATVVGLAASVGRVGVALGTYLLRGLWITWVWGRPCSTPRS